MAFRIGWKLRIISQKNEHQYTYFKTFTGFLGYLGPQVKSCPRASNSKARRRLLVGRGH